LNLLQHNDVAVLTVDPPIIYSAAISPVCLPPFNNAADQFVGKDAAIMGWGRLESGKHCQLILEHNESAIKKKKKKKKNRESSSDM
jgi:hypothetical protein